MLLVKTKICIQLNIIFFNYLNLYGTLKVFIWYCEKEENVCSGNVNSSCDVKKSFES